MPPPQIGLYHLTLIGSLHNQQTQNGFYFKDRNDSPDDDYQLSLTDLMNDFMNNIYDKIKLWANQEWHTVGLIGTTLFPRNGPMIELGPLAEEGAQTDDSLPSYCAGVLAVRTGVGGRRYRGRIYFAGVSENLCSAGRLNGGSLTQLQDIGNALLVRYGAGGSSLRHVYGVYSRVEGDDRQAGPPPFITHSPLAFHTATQITARSIVYTQRKRLIGHGG